MDQSSKAIVQQTLMVLSPIDLCYKIIKSLMLKLKSNLNHIKDLKNAEK